jgi:hypothetical protein
MRRAPLLVLVIALALGVATGLARAAERAVVPLPGAAACKTQPPVLLSPGRAPRAPLRVDLEKMAGRTQKLLEVESVAAKTYGPDGTTRPNSSRITSRGVARSGRVAGGHLPLRLTLHLSGTAFPTKPTISVAGWMDSLNGGALEGEHEDDHFPREAVGIGASWRVVNCDEINLTHARETRTYTLHSLAGGVVSLTYRDVVTLDPGHLDLGSQTVGGQTLKFTLVTLQGSASGETRIPLARSVAQTSHTVTSLRVRFRASAPNQPAIVIRTDMVDTDDLTPTG